jgi:hypothetical protein
VSRTCQIFFFDFGRLFFERERERNMDEVFISPFGEAFVQLRDKHLQKLEEETVHWKKTAEERYLQIINKDQLIQQLQLESQSVKVPSNIFE